MKDLSINKLYYSIGEVSQITGVPRHVIRYWETEFPELKPMKNRAGNRVFTTKDIDIINHIKKMLKEEKYTIEGAKTHLKNILSKENNSNNKPTSTQYVIKKDQQIDLFSELDKYATKVSGKSSVEIAKEYKEKLIKIRDKLLQIYNKL